MANTYIQIYIQIIFSVRDRENLIKDEFREQIHKYITGIITNKSQKLIAVNSVLDHIHILIGQNSGDIALSDLVGVIKSNSSKYINKQKWLKRKFHWQEGYGGFSYSRSQLPKVIRYIENQKEHHKLKTFKEEYLEFLDKFGVEYDLKYVFD